MCNVLSGQVQSYFADYEFHAGLSLPVVTRGFDDYLGSSYLQNESSIAYNWMVHKNQQKLFEITVSLQSDLLHQNRQKPFQIPSDGDDDDHIEFL